MNKLIIIRGLPGSGKSTKAKQIVKADKTNRTKHFEADMFHILDGEYHFNIDNAVSAHEWCLASTEHCLSKGYTVVVSNTFTTSKEVRAYLDIASKYGVEVEVITMREDYGNIHNVPQEVLDRMKSRWEEFEL